MFMLQNRLKKLIFSIRPPLNISEISLVLGNNQSLTCVKTITSPAHTQAIKIVKLIMNFNSTFSITAYKHTLSRYMV